MKVADIRIGRRIREDIGDIDALCRSIEEVGLLQPVVVTPDAELVAGRRRLEAFKKLGRDEIPATVAENLADALLLLKAERDENICRKDFTPSEYVALGERLELLERPKAEERKGGRPPKETGGNLPPVSADGGKTRDKVAAALGISGKTYEKAKKVITAARNDPKRFAPIAKKMDETGDVDPAFREVQKAEREREREVAAREAAKYVPPSENLNVFHDTFLEVAKDIPDDTVDLIFTDPPYDRESLPMYADLGTVAARVLKPGGSLICYLGQMHLHEVLDQMKPYLRFWWPLCCLHTGQSARMTEYGIVVKWKPMLWFVKFSRGDKHTFVDDLVESQQEKHAHEWQQGLAEALYYIDKLTLPGGLVFDPFCGGGTTAVAAKQLGRRWITCDTDPNTVAIARKRIHEC